MQSISLPAAGSSCLVGAIIQLVVFTSRDLQRGQGKSHHRTAHNDPLLRFCRETTGVKQSADRCTDQGADILAMLQRLTNHRDDPADQRDVFFYRLRDGKHSTDVLHHDADIQWPGGRLALLYWLTV